MDSIPRQALEEAGSGARNGALERGLHILEVLVDAPAPMSLTDIANATGLESNTVHRLLQRLTGTGNIVKHPASKRFSAGPRTLFSKSQYHPLNELRRETREPLRSLWEEFGETTCLIVFNGHERMLVDLIQGRQSLSPYFDTRMESPLHGSVTGIILLMELPKLDRRRLLGPGPYKAHTPETITSPKEFEKELAATAERGYAIARDTSFMGITALGAPLRYRDKFVGCLTMAGSSSSITKSRIESLGQALSGAANLVTCAAPSLKAVAHYFGV